MSDQTPMTNTGSVLEISDDLAIDKTISEEDRQEILTTIEQVVEDSRISVDADLFKITSQKKGMFLPLFINFLCLALIAGAFFFASKLSEGKQETMSQDTIQYLSASGKIIEELKRQNEDRLKAKEDEILRIQQELSQIDTERETLAEDMAAQLEARENQLRANLEAEIAAERERLQASGASEEDISSQLSKLQSQLQAQADSELSRLEEESQAALETKQRELELLQSRLDERNTEREELEAARLEIEENAKAREEELTAEFEAERAALQDAEARLSALADLQEQEKLLQDQIFTTYSTLMNKIEDGELEGALSDIESLRSIYLSIDTNKYPNIADRKDVEVFLLDNLKNSIQSQTKIEAAGTSVLAEAAGNLLGAQELAEQGNTAYQEGQILEAKEYLTQAVSKIPTLTEAYNTLRKIEIQEQESLASNFITAGAQYYSQGNYDSAIGEYKKAAAMTSQDVATLNRSLSALESVYSTIETGKLNVKDEFIQSLRNDHQEEILNLKAKNASDIETLRAEHRSEIAALEQENEDALAEEKSGYDALIASLNADHQDALDLLEESYEAKLEEKENEIAALMSDLDANTSSYSSSVEELKASYEEQITLLKNQHADELAALEEDLEAMVGLSEEEYLTRIRALEDEKDTAIASLTESYEQQILDLKDEHQKAIEALNSAGGENVTDMVALLNAELLKKDETISELNAQLMSIEQKNEDRIDDLIDSQREAVSELEDSIDQLEKDKRNLQGTISSLNTTIASQQSDLTESKNSLTALNTQYSRLNTRYENVQEELDEAEEERDQLQIDLDAAVDELVGFVQEVTGDQRYTNLVDIYADMKERMNLLFLRGEDKDITEAVTLYDNFFTDKDIDDTFQGIAEMKAKIEGIKQAEKMEETAALGRIDGLNDVIGYLRYRENPAGRETQGERYQEKTETDTLFRRIVSQIDSLLETSGDLDTFSDGTAGTSFSEINLVGTISSVSIDTIVIEPWGSVTLSTGQAILIRRKSSRGQEESIAEGFITSTSGGRVTAKITSILADGVTARTMDLVYTGSE